MGRKGWSKTAGVVLACSAGVRLPPPLSPGPFHCQNASGRTTFPHLALGTHRRVHLKDLMQYQRQRDSRRHTTLDDLRRKFEAAGLYEKGSGGADGR